MISNRFSRDMRGIALMLLAMAFFTTLDTCAKLVTRELAPWVAVFFRYGVASLFSVAWLLWRKGPDDFATSHPLLQALRGLLLMGSTICNFMAMQHLQLAQTAAIFFTIPLLVSVLSVPLLGEQVGLRRWLAVLAGFFGVLVIMRPGLGGFHWAMLLSLAASLQGALYNIATRKVGGRDAVETSLFYVCLFGVAGAALPASLHWQWPHGYQWALLVGIGLVGTIGHFLLIEAHRLTTAAKLAPFIYTQIIWMSLSGYLVFGDVPGIWTLVGAAIVVVSGLYLLHREHVHGKLNTVAAPGD